MKLNGLLVTTTLLVALVPVAIQQERDEKGLTNTDDWQEGSFPDIPKEYEGKRFENNEDDENIPKRQRSSKSGMKRRRRMRKRYRTTTESPSSNEDETLTVAAQAPEAVYTDRHLNGERREDEDSEQGTNLEVPIRRRPGKRRRRPHRRYQDPSGNGPTSEGDENYRPVRRRRKGGRRRIKAPPVSVEESETSRPEIFETTTNVNNWIQEEATIVVETEKPNERAQEILLSTVSSLFTKVNENKFNAAENDKNEEQNHIKRTKPYGSRHDIALPKPLKDIEPTDEESIEKQIFDRKALFSKSKRLPETSAVIRRKLGPTNNTATTTLEPPTTIYHNKLSKNDISTENPVPKQKVYIRTTTGRPTSTTPAVTTEEPNYPKYQLRKETIDISKTVKTTVRTVSRKITVTTTEPPITTVQDTIKSEDKNNSNKITQDDNNATLLNDSILELLKTESGSERLLKILQLRNMTLAQLLEHRERGSHNKFHFTDVFTAETRNLMSQELEKMRKENNTQIQFPDQDILRLFPEFVSDHIEKMVQTKGDNKSSSQESREPRVFESMPEFTTTTTTRKTLVETKVENTAGKPYKTWRTVPNLKPVSIRGDYREIPITRATSTSTEGLEGVYILDENEIIHRSDLRNRVNVNSKESSSSSVINSFKRIPVTVKSAIIISTAIFILAIFGFLSILVSCRVRQKKARLRAKQDILCEHLQNEDFMASQQSLSPVLTKHHSSGPSRATEIGPGAHVFTQGVQTNSNPHRHYYLWRTLRKTFQYD